MLNKQKHQLTAFTLIEVLVTVTLTAIIMLGVTSLFVTLITVAGKARLSQNIRENGTLAMQKIIEELRNAKSINSTCNGLPLTSIAFQNTDGTIRTLQSYDGRIRLRIDSTDYFLSSNNNLLTNLTFVCYDAHLGQYIDFSFTLTSKTKNPTTSSLDFRSGVSLRN